MNADELSELVQSYSWDDEKYNFKCYEDSSDLLDVCSLKNTATINYRILNWILWLLSYEIGR